MDPVSETGLATPSLHHGCSTAIRENDWVEVTSKSGGNKKKTKDKNDKKKSYAEAAKASEAAPMESVPSILGCPPIAEVKKNCNQYSSLSYDEEDEEEPMDNEVEVVQQHLSSAVNTPKEPKKKKLKTGKDDDFFATCKYYAELPPPEYAYSVKATNDNEYAILEHSQPDDEPPSDSDSSVSSPDVVFDIGHKTMDNIRCTDALYKLDDYDYDDLSTDSEDKIEYDYSLNKEAFRKAFQDPTIELKSRRMDKFIYMARTLPKPYDCVYPAMLRTLINPPTGFKFQYDKKPYNQDIWTPVGMRKKRELNREESSFLMYEITRNGMFDSYKYHYNKTEETLDRWKVPHSIRRHFRQEELNYISLMIHDTLPENYCEKLLPVDSEPEGKLFQFFSIKDDINTARQKWYAAIKKEYKSFWKTVISEIPIETINNATIVLYYDILPIIKFINPQAIHMIYNHVNYSSRLNKIINKATEVEAFVETRHKFYYKWMYLGWNMLPPNYPLCK